MCVFTHMCVDSHTCVWVRTRVCENTHVFVFSHTTLLDTCARNANDMKQREQARRMSKERKQMSSGKSKCNRLLCIFFVFLVWQEKEEISSLSLFPACLFVYVG